MHRRDREYAKTATEEALNLFPALRSRVNDPAAQLSGGQQQMLALAMAFLAKPDVLMIDELSLGLAPLVVEQLLAVVRQFREQGVTVILVEQSVNVALTTADKAFFMEKGAIRFHGLTAELLERPDLLRSIFLEGAATAEGGEVEEATKDAPLAAIANRAPEPVHANGGERRVVLETRGITRRFSGITAVDDVSIQLHEGEIVGIVGPNGAGKTTLFDLISGFLLPDSGSVIVEGVDVTRRRPQRRAKLGLARSFQDARLFGALTVHQAICVALDRPIQVLGPDHRDALLPERRALRAPPREAGRRAHRDDGARRLPRQVRVRPVHRKPPHRRPRVSDRHRAEGDPVRRAVVGHRAAGDRGARSAAPAHPRHHGREHPAHRARHAARQLRLRPHHRLRPRAGRGRGRLGAGPEPPARRRVVSRVDPRGHRAFRSEPGSSTTEVVEGARP